MYGRPLRPSRLVQPRRRPQLGGLYARAASLGLGAAVRAGRVASASLTAHVIEGSGTGPAPATVVIVSVVGALGQATLTWEAPATKVDGSALASGDIVRYWLRRYSTAGVLQEGPASMGNVTTFVSSDPSGTWEYTVSCESTYGESEESARWPVTVT